MWRIKFSERNFVREESSWIGTFSDRNFTREKTLGEEITFFFREEISPTGTISERKFLRENLCQGGKFSEILGGNFSEWKNLRGK